MADAAPAVPAEPAVDDNTETKKNIWQRWGRKQDWQNDLEKKAAYKSFDIPEEDDTNLTKTNTTTNTGASGGAIAAAALAGGIPATVLAAMVGLSSMRGSQPQAATPAAPPAVSVPDSAYDVLFFDAQGNQVAVPRAVQK